MRELQDKIANLGELTSSLQANNETLKRELTRFATENEILRVTQNHHDTHHQNGGGGGGGHDKPPPVPGPMEFAPTDFHSLAEKGANPPHRITFDEETGEKLLNAGATWDLIQNHELFRRGFVDIADVSDRLQGLARCNGQGPAFKESHVLNAIHQSIAGGSDELI